MGGMLFNGPPAVGWPVATILPPPARWTRRLSGEKLADVGGVVDRDHVRPVPALHLQLDPRAVAGVVGDSVVEPALDAVAEVVAELQLVGFAGHDAGAGEPVAGQPETEGDLVIVYPEHQPPEIAQERQEQEREQPEYDRVYRLVLDDAAHGHGDVEHDRSQDEQEEHRVESVRLAVYRLAALARPLFSQLFVLLRRAPSLP